MSRDEWVSTTAARGMLGVSSRTLRRYTDTGVLPDVRGAGGRRIFPRAAVEALRDQRTPQASTPVVVYARVSSHRQRAEGDLDRQIERLHAAASTYGELVGTYRDVASGLSDRRGGLFGAITACHQHPEAVLLVEHRDRLARFGTRSLEHSLTLAGTRLVVLDADEAGASVEADLVADMLAVVTSFAGRLYGQRSARQKQARAAVEAVTRGEG